MPVALPWYVRLGQVILAIHDGYTVTTFPDGMEVHARHDDCAHLGQARTAVALGYPDVAAMNREHDPYHHLLALWLGLPWSRTLRAKATGETLPHGLGEAEEAAVLAIQRWAVRQGVEALALLQKYAQGKE